MKLYRTIVADPPWDVKRLQSPGAKGFGSNVEVLRSVALPYQTMTVEEIAALKIPAEKDAHCYIWTINKYVEETYSIMRSWGFRPVELLTWAKTPMGLGMGGAFVNTTEFILFGKRGNLAANSRVDTSWWNWKRGLHSEKPEAFQDIVEQVSPPPYLEIFARRYRLGWDVFGNEVESHVQISA